MQQEEEEKRTKHNPKRKEGQGQKKHAKKRKDHPLIPNPSLRNTPSFRPFQKFFEPAMSIERAKVQLGGAVKSWNILHPCSDWRSAVVEKKNLVLARMRAVKASKFGYHRRLADTYKLLSCFFYFFLLAASYFYCCFLYHPDREALWTLVCQAYFFCYLFSRCLNTLRY